MTLRFGLLSTVAAAALVAAPAPTRASIALKRIATLREPMQLVRLPGDRRRMAVVERRGVLRLFRDGRLIRRPFLNISSQVDVPSSDVSRDHGGLLSIAFAPDYKRSRRLYVFYTHRDGSLRIEEFKRDPRRRERALRASGRTVLSLPGRKRFNLGGQIAFASDRLMYVGLGEQEEQAAAQDLGDLRGKLLRIDPRRSGTSPYRIPASNPFVGRPGVRPEIWAYGLRNPFRFSITPGGSVVIGDVGGSLAEEIDVVPRTRPGANLGWPAFEGRRPTGAPPVSGHTPPVLELAHTRRFCSIIGGLVVRDRSLPIRGRYLYSDFCLGQVRSVKLGRSTARGDRIEERDIRSPVGFGEDARRRVYVLSLTGPVYRLVRD